MIERRRLRTPPGPKIPGGKGSPLNYGRLLEICRCPFGALVPTFIHVTLRILRPGLLISALFAFIQSFGETVVAIFIFSRDAETLPRKMLDSIRQEADPVIAVVSTLLYAAVLLYVSEPLARRGIRSRCKIGAVRSLVR